MDTKYLLRLAAKAKSPSEPDYNTYCFTFDECELSRLAELVAREYQERLEKIRNFAQQQCDAGTDEAILWAQVVNMAGGNNQPIRPESVAPSIQLPPGPLPDPVTGWKVS